ncbi:type II secretion system inner membrane protein GspF [Variovorax sp. PCZ-1]|uniref:type II secretion system inner membrane protein GspF n=1 Tax=Variovorax sp. PCZ-1 TaxID=2835533 RepID=UPI001BCA9419|nr:type II secretion system inner membrane protein GspF [Variovorax sp. PCZ-1]MBS7806185.1 type II secretion system inner membrane protein GspF [Variovorax sp. PCZ-1]
MPAYQFEALDAQGTSRKGVIEADTAKSARAMLRAQALVPMAVDAVMGQGADDKKDWKQINLWGGRVFSSTLLAVWTRQLSGLLSAGLPLERALTALADEAEDDKQRNVVAALRAEVNAGSSFAKALSQHPREFNEIYRAVVSAGEASGHLDTVLEKLADDLEESQALKAKLIGASLYPAIVTLVAIIIVVFLVTYVVPQVAGVFAGSKRALPLLTTIMLGISGFVRTYGLWMLAALILIAGSAVYMRSIEVFRLRMDAAWLRMPVVGKLAKGFNAARFASTLGMLAGAGVPILKALQAAAETLHNRAMRADAMDALTLVREGAPLASAMAQKKNFPGLIAMFARLGEQTGKLPEMLQRAAKQLSGEVQRRAIALATILEPLLIVAMGVIVLLIVLAVLMPIIQLNQLVK